MPKDSKKAFTLIELLIVIAIIALLAILLTLILVRNITKANDAKRKADIARISTAMEDYYTDNDCYPDPSVFTKCGSDALKPYLNTIPCDPVYKYPYCYFVENETPRSGCYQKYRVLTTLKYYQDPDIRALGCNGSDYCGWESECGADTNRYGFNYGVASRNTFITNPSVVVPSSPGPSSGNPQPTNKPSSSPFPSQSPSPTPSPSVLPSPGNFACTPQGSCDVYDDPLGKGCPITFQDRNICIQYCSYTQYRCTQ